MQLTAISVTNYRSIQKQTAFQLGELTTLVGPNNEGETNLLRAVALGMSLVSRWSRLPESFGASQELTSAAYRFLVRQTSFRAKTRPEELTYRWSADYPINKQENKRTGPTVFRLTFRLSESEVSEFYSETGITSNGELPVEIKLTRTSGSFGILKPGRGAATHRAKAKQIAQFISARLTYVMIPAIRTMSQAQSLLNDLSMMRMRDLTKSDRYRELTAEISKLKSDALAELGKEVTSSIKEYLPSVTEVSILGSDTEYSESVEDVLIDDGSITTLANKGEGVKSLVTLALLQELAKQRATDHTFLLLVDEPESHLHPRAVHELQTLFHRLSNEQQVVLATHNAIFVNRDSVSSNILVQSNEARPAKSMKQIREAIGVQLHDNLDSAETVVLVEGVTDTKALQSLLPDNDSRRQDLSSGRIVIKHTSGAGKMRSLITREKSTVCRIVAVLDGDSTGREQAKNIQDSLLLDPSNVFLVQNGTQKNSELEDWLDPQAYLKALTDTVGRTFTQSHFANQSKKWSEKFSDAASSLGVAEDEHSVLERAKIALADIASKRGEGCVRESAKENLDALRSVIWK